MAINHHRRQSNYRAYLIARAVACVSFIILTFIGISSLARAMTLTHVPEENGVPIAWETSSPEFPDSITVPITYWDQRVDACDATDRQFEWGKCFYWTKGALQGIVQDTLGRDNLPVPTFSSSDAAWAANHDIFTMNVTGHNPVLPTDNFYRWFHEVDGLSRRINGRTVTFTRTGNGATYTYGGQHIYPLDSIAGFDSGDVKLRGADGKMHNFHFTGHLRIAMRITASGHERFRFSGDDDVWVFLNRQLILDIGGLHEPLAGWFLINPDGTVSTHVNSVSNVSDRTDEITECMKELQTGRNKCNTDFNDFLTARNQAAEHTIDAGLSAGDVVYLDFFYAERSSDGSNTQITIEEMDWPIPADAELSGKIVKELDNSNIFEFRSSLTNHDPEHPLTLTRLASHLTDTPADAIPDSTASDTSTGFIPLSAKTLYYTTTPDDEDSWAPLNLFAPEHNQNGFTLETPLILNPYDTAGDTVYFRYYAETLTTTGNLSNVISYYTTVNDTDRIVSESTHLPYDRHTNPNPVGPVDPADPNPDQPTLPEPNTPFIPDLPGSDIIDGDLSHVGPLGQIVYIPNTGLINDAATFFTTEFASVILSQPFVMAVLLIFAVSFAFLISYRKYRPAPTIKATATKSTSAKATAATKKTPIPKSTAKTRKPTIATKLSKTSPKSASVAKATNTPKSTNPSKTAKSKPRPTSKAKK